MAFHFPPMSGGGSVVITDIVNKMAELGHGVTVIVPDVQYDGEPYAPRLHPGVRVVRTETPSRTKIKIAARRCQANMRRAGQELGRGSDFVFTVFHPFHLVPRAAIQCAERLGIPCVVKVDDAIYAKSTGIKSVQRRIEKMINGRTLRAAGRVLAVNDRTRSVIAREYGVRHERMSIVPNGVDLSMFPAAPPGRNPKKMVFTGGMYYHRGLDILLEAMPEIIRRVPDAELSLIGSGGEMQRLQEIVSERSLGDSVRFAGWIGRERIPDSISDAAVGIGPLRLTDVTAGALPVKVLEYMAASLPIVAQRGTLHGDVLDGNGFFIDGADELADRLAFLLSHPEKARSMGERSARMVQKFSWDNIVDGILQAARASP